ncbi:MAG: aspartate kinase [Propionibacteriaceae bacterium]|jgi:aspartate kinase|nr:aspartate kinase [Propionibacteriaceae bacterium]
MTVKVVKFGGSSLASAGRIKQALAIVAADPARRYLVASAPGKRSGADVKVTDLMYRLQAAAEADRPAVLAQLEERFATIVADLGVDFDLAGELALLEQGLAAGEGPDYFASRGEYLNSKIIAAKLGWPFLEAADLIRFDAAGAFLPEATNAALAQRLGGLEQAVLPGFYGATPDGRVKTFSRGGSDITGALVARAVAADVYENWTDVSGVLMADPRIVDSPAGIAVLSYDDLHDLSSMGASVLHPAAVEPVRRAGIPINIRNTFHPDDAGTWIQADAPAPGPAARPIIGLTGREGFALIGLVESGAQPAGRVAADLLAALDQASITVHLTADQGRRHLVAVEAERYREAVQRIYAALAG